MPRGIGKSTGLSGGFGDKGKSVVLNGLSIESGRFIFWRRVPPLSDGRMRRMHYCFNWKDSQFHHGRVHFVGTHHDGVQGTVILALAVVNTLLNGAFDAGIGLTAATITVHSDNHPFFWKRSLCPHLCLKGGTKLVSVWRQKICAQVLSSNSRNFH